VSADKQGGHEPTDEEISRYADQIFEMAFAFPQGAPTEDPFHDSVMALHEHDDIAPLQAFFRSCPSLSPAQWESLARLVDLLHARGQKRRPGNPGGKMPRWKKPDYVAAFIVKRIEEAWTKEHRRHNIPAEKRAKFVDDVINDVVKTDPRPNRERVLRLLRDPKHLRI
jgi:hypothetical protein